MSLGGTAANVARHQPRPGVRVANGLAAVAFAAFVLAAYWPTVRVFDLHRADPGYQGTWIAGHARRIDSVTAGGAADRAGLRPGDVLQFDPGRDADWILASYRPMPDGFSATVPVRHADGTNGSATIAPDRVAYLPAIGDRVALLIRICGVSIALVVGVVLVWARPSLMTWSILLATTATAPARVWATGFLAFDATSTHLSPMAVAVGALMYLVVFNVPFGLTFLRDTLARWSVPKRGLLLVALGLAPGTSPGLYVRPFAQDGFLPRSFVTWLVVATLVTLAAVVALMRTYRQAGGEERARLKWALLGISGGLLGNLVATTFVLLPFNLANPLSGAALTPAHWVMGVVTGFVLPFSLGYAILRQRVVDVQFAVSRTVVYGIVSTLVLVFLAVLHWLLGRMIEHSRLAFGLEGLAAVALGLLLHRASHGINTGVDRVLFRRHHSAEQRLRQVTAALPFATTERSIAESIVVEPTRHLELASAALFYRETAEGPLRRVLTEGWSESHASELEADSLLVRYLQAEHAALRLDGGQQWLPEGTPEGSAHPVLAIPIVTQHVLTAVVLYGAHVNSTLPDPDEVELLEALAKAAAASHQQVRIAQLAREVDVQRIRNEQLEAALRVMAAATGQRAQP